MKEWETVKLYGKRLNEWKETRTRPDGREYEATTQVEYKYTEYDCNGNALHEGTEDFSSERLHECTGIYDVWTWDGQKVNKGGNRWFECVRVVKINLADRKKLTELMTKWYPNAAAIRIRKIA
jgi:hypothetical protein